MVCTLRLIWGLMAGCLAACSVARAGTHDAFGLTQAPMLRAWGTEAGLPQNTITAIVQTPDGYMWLGTHDGLVRFDGVRFKTFGLASGLPAVDVSTLYVDQQGTLWVGTYGAGLCLLREGRATDMADPGSQPGSDTITCLQADLTGRLWVGTSGGLRFCHHGKMLDPTDLTNLTHTPIHALLCSRDGQTMWIASVAEGLLAARAGQVAPCPGPPGHEKIIGRCLFEDRQGALWVSIGNGMVLRRTEGVWRVFGEGDGLPFAYVTSITQTTDGTIWAGSLDDGLYRLAGERFQGLHRADQLSAEDIRSLYPDPDGNLWVGTRTGGLNRLGRRHLRVVAAAQGLTNDFTRAVAETADGTLWAGTVGGSLYRGGLDGFQPFRPEPVGALIYYYADVDPVIATPDGSLWWGGNGALLQWQNQRLAAVYTNLPWIKNVFVTALQNDRHGGLWIGTSGGNLVHEQAGQFAEFPQLLTRSAITSLAVGADDTVWVGTVAAGVKRIPSGSGAVTTITNGLASIAIRTLHLDDQGILWMGTAGGGLSCWRNGRISNFTASLGLPASTVSQIVADDQGDLWLGCNSGIYQVSKPDLLACADGHRPFLHARSFGINDGMLAQECSGGFCPAGLKTKAGLICLSTVRGLVFIDPNQHPDQTRPQKALLEEVLVNGRVQALPRDDVAAGVLVVPPGNRDLELHYTVIDFSAPEKTGFRYQLTGLDQGWKEALARRVVYYQNVPPGSYTFQVQACNAAGVWNGETARLAVVVQPFVWETPWFRAGLALALAGALARLLWWLFRLRYRWRMTRLQTLHAIERERLRIAQDMHDHVGGMLTQVSQLSDLGLHETGHQELVRHRFERIGSRARDAVRALDEIVWATNPQNDNLASFAEYVSRYSDEFFEYTGIRCWQEVPESLPPLPLRADVRHNVFLAVRESLNNVLKHSRCTEVWLRLKLDHGRVTLEITDNGCGFAPEGVAPGGNGLANMRARLAEEGGQAILLSAPGKGTCARFIFDVTCPA